MRKIKTQRSAKGYRDLKVDCKTTRFVTNRRMPPRTADHIWHAHALKGIREIPRAGWAPWELTVAGALRDLEIQRYFKANRYYNALERNQSLLEAVSVRRQQLQETAEKLEAAVREREAAYKELEGASRGREAAYKELEAVSQGREAAYKELEATTRRLEYTSTYLQTLMDTMLDILIVIDPSGAITDLNRATEHISGYAREEMVGQPLTKLFAGPDLVRTAIEKVLAEGSFRDQQLVLLSRGGREMPVNFNAAALQGPDERVTGALFSVRDITERLMVEEALRRQATDLASSNAELEQFAYVASHDLQEPLRKVLAFGDRLKARSEAVVGDEGRDYLERMQDAAKRMQILINDLLTFSRVTTRAQPFGQANLAETAREVVSDLEVYIEQVGGRVEVSDLPMIEADPTQMRQLLQNLISNGLKFHRPDAPPVVKVRAKILKGRRYSVPPMEDRCQVFIEDNGIGFDEKYNERIFGVFQRLHGRNEYEGTGIGLAICRKIVERHGGEIAVRSAPGQGSTFIITLPVKQRQEISLPYLENAPEPPDAAR